MHRVLLWLTFRACRWKGNKSVTTYSPFGRVSLLVGKVELSLSLQSLVEPSYHEDISIKATQSRGEEKYPKKAVKHRIAS